MKPRVYPGNLSGGPCGPQTPLARLLCAAQALAVFGCAAGTRPPDDARPTRHPLHIRAPDLAQPLFEALPAAGGYPNEVVKEGVFERINRDRLLAGLLPVAWDEAASRVADALCAQQIREATRGHFLMDGVPPSPEARRARVLPPRPALRGQDAFAPEAWSSSRSRASRLRLP